MKKVLWVSRHTMTEDQIRDLKRALNDDFETICYKETVKDISEITPFIGSVDIIAAVLPTELLADLFEAAEGKPVIQSVSERVDTGRIVKLPDGREEKEFAFVHSRWQKIVEFKLKVENF